MLKTSTGLRNHMLAVGSAKAALDGGFIRVYEGPEPASADAAIDPLIHKLLVTIYSDGTAAGLALAATAADGFIEKSSTETWSGTVAETGVAKFFRHVGPTDTGALSTTQPRLQGTVARAGAELNISDTALVAAAPQAVNYYTLELPSF